MDRIGFKSKDPVLDGLTGATFSEESRFENLGVMVSHYSGGEDYTVFYDKLRGLDIGPLIAVEWLKLHIPRDLPITEDVNSGVVSQEMNNSNSYGKKIFRRYSLFRGDIDSFFAQVEASKYAFEC